MIIVPNKKAIVLKVRDVERITTLIPKSKVLKPNIVAVKHGVEEVRVLRNLGFAVPSPIEYYYSWPGLYKPFGAQEATAAFLSSHNRAFCLNDLGTGKSLATLWAYDYLRSKSLAGKALIVSPLSTLERTWADELFKHFPHLNYAVLHGTREKRLKLLEQDVDVYIINHDGVEIIAEALTNRMDITHVVVDEIAQVARNASTDRWKALNLVINKQVPRQAWGLTGTPTPNAPTDAWAQCRLLVPERVPPYFNRFKDQVMRQVGPFLWLPRDNATEIIKEAMQPAIRFSRDECVDLPPCLYETRQVDLTTEQARAYQQMMEKLAAEVDSGEVIAVNEAVKMNKLLQIACVAHDTDVLTHRGWVPIQNVTDADLVWDGDAWVSQGGAAYKGFKPVVSVSGVRLTEDHKVWVGEWVEAKEIVNGHAAEKFARTEVRLPNGYIPERDIAESVQVAGNAGADRTYDLINCGPRSRFVVRGSTGATMIVHNCGVVYDTDGNEVSIPSGHRLKAVLEVVEETPYKVIVFVPFVSAVNKVADYLTSKHVSVECIHGGVSKNERDRIFASFQKHDEPRVLVAQPAAMSHGLTLTAASTIVWFAPTTSNETFEQANGRISRPGQKNNQFIIMLEGTTVERKLYDRLKNKQKAQGLLLSMVKEERK